MTVVFIFCQSPKTGLSRYLTLDGFRTLSFALFGGNRELAFSGYICYLKPMPNIDAFTREAKAIRARNQAKIDMKIYLYQWTGYNAIKVHHRKEIQELAQKYAVNFDEKKWKLNDYWKWL